MQTTEPFTPRVGLGGQQQILLAGGSGYVGGRLRLALEKRGARLRCLVRKPEFMRPGNIEVVQGNVLRPESLKKAMQGVDVAYYLVRMLGSSSKFRHNLLVGARNFAETATEAGVQKIIYLGATGRRGGLLNQLDARLEIGDLLRASPVPTLEFRASPILGSGSFLFEMVRALADRLPVMVVPHWVYLKFQPIAIEDVVSYLVLALELELHQSQVIQIAGPDWVSFTDLMKEYGYQRGLPRRLRIPLPFSSVELSSRWLALFAPVPARTTHKLIEDLRYAAPVHTQLAWETFPVIPRGYREAIARALVNEDMPYAETRWSDALSSGGDATIWRPGRFRGARVFYTDEGWVPHPPAIAFRPIERIGGETGWYCSNWLWRLRGFLDLLAGGVGVRRGRHHPEKLQLGDTIDFWRVEAFEPDRMLRLQAEMRVPGRAWLQFKVQPQGSGSLLKLTAIFAPKGWKGRLYWYSLYPIHLFIFRGMLRGMLREMERELRKEAAVLQPVVHQD